MSKMSSNPPFVRRSQRPLRHMCKPMTKLLPSKQYVLSILNQTRCPFLPDTIHKSLNTTANNSPDRKRAEEQLYRLRSAPPAESADSTPPELARECVRLGTQPEHSGSSNEIWKGRWLNTQDVALVLFKQYKLDTRDEKAILRFERQIKVWRKLDNPFVLRLYGWCKFEGETYLVSPWLRNGDVVKYLDGNRSRDQKCLSLVHEIAQGLHYLHKQSIIHGSLNPSNILVGDDHCAVISDFSFAKLATPDAKITQKTPQVNAFRYQAPEVILDQPISEASDIYSWAMTALEIITGNPPYHTQRSPGQLLTELTMKNKCPNRSDYNSSVLNTHPEIWELFSECWRRKPEERPKAERVVEVLRKILSSK
ncbi:hypothetical protein FRC00_013773 [Tulasnella sp. 408]|nr:hypothetical protein FRC00_013773 [Tulasnella sp. 408]